MGYCSNHVNSTYFSAVCLASIITPIRVAFIEIDNITWNLIDMVFDLFFLADIAISFMSAYYNRMEVLIYSRRTIAL